MRARHVGQYSASLRTRAVDLKVQLLALLLGVFLLAGCGGGGGGGGASGINPTITVDWPARSRDATAPSSATSVEVTLVNSATGPNGVTSTFDRGNTATAFNQTYTLPLGVAPGTYTVYVYFLPLEDGGTNTAGDAVGSATGTATISSAALSLGSFTTTGAVVSVAVLSGQNVPVGSTVMLNAAAYNSSVASEAADLVVTPGSVFWNVVTTDGSMTVTTDGHITATSVGTITVTATVDGVVSPSQTIASYAEVATAGCTNSTYLPNYATEMETSTDPTYMGVLRTWTSFPVTVAIINNSYLNAGFQAMAQQGMANWNTGTAGQVTFQVVSASQSPDITITFEPSSQIDGSDDGTVGLTTVYPSSTNASILSHADILVATDLSTDAQTLNTMTHELGHSLGIGGHSNVDQDLMFPYLNDAFAPAVDDVNTLYTGYCGSFPTSSSAKRAPRPPRASKGITIIDTPKK
jgi:predicted Zn-dependent protease